MHLNFYYMFSEKFSIARIVIGFLIFTDPLKMIFSICMPHWATILIYSHLVIMYRQADK